MHGKGDGNRSRRLCEHLVQEDQRGRRGCSCDAFQAMDMPTESGQVLGQVLRVSHICQHFSKPLEPLRLRAVCWYEQAGLWHKRQEPQSLQTGCFATWKNRSTELVKNRHAIFNSMMLILAQLELRGRLLMSTGSFLDSRMSGSPQRNGRLVTPDAGCV